MARSRIDVEGNQTRKRLTELRQGIDVEGNQTRKRLAELRQGIDVEGHNLRTGSKTYSVQSTRWG